MAGFVIQDTGKQGGLRPRTFLCGILIPPGNNIPTSLQSRDVDIIFIHFFMGGGWLLLSGVRILQIPTGLNPFVVKILTY